MKMMMMGRLEEEKVKDNDRADWTKEDFISNLGLKQRQKGAQWLFLSSGEAGFPSRVAEVALHRRPIRRQRSGPCHMTAVTSLEGKLSEKTVRATWKPLLPVSHVLVGVFCGSAGRQCV